MAVAFDTRVPLYDKSRAQLLLWDSWTCFVVHALVRCFTGLLGIRTKTYFVGQRVGAFRGQSRAIFYLIQRQRKCHDSLVSFFKFPVSVTTIVHSCISRRIISQTSNFPQSSFLSSKLQNLVNWCHRALFFCCARKKTKIFLISRKICFVLWSRFTPRKFFLTLRF